MRIDGVTRTTHSMQAKPVDKRPGKTATTDAPIWNELRGKYDIRRATFDELRDISQELYGAREISLKEHSLLTFNPQLSPQWSEVTKGQPGARYFITNADSLGKRDWIKEYEARVEQDKRVGNSLGQENNQKILDLLRKLI